MSKRLYQRMGKRLLDLGLTIPALVVCAPMLALLALLVRFQQGAGIVFYQQRAGRYGMPFTLFKFRTMTEACDGNGHLLSDVQRLTPFGRFMRSASLDELLELINVLKGDMSLVGPRPLLLQYLPLYTSEQMRRHEVPPGITGWTQVNGRNALSWEQKFALDTWYVEHQSLWLDLKILAVTVWKVCRSDGINQPGHATAEYFQGVSQSSEDTTDLS